MWSREDLQRSSSLKKEIEIEERRVERCGRREEWEEGAGITAVPLGITVHRSLRAPHHLASSLPVLRKSTVQCSAVQYSAVQCSAVQCDTVQCSAVQCGTAAYSCA
jgi:hypothetical protein